jgi:DNA-binding NarL/FixJ family response regulator
MSRKDRIDGVVGDTLEMAPHPSPAGGSNSPERVAVCDAAPVYRAGIVRALTDEELIGEEVDDPSDWLSPPTRRTVLLSVRQQQDWELITQLKSDYPEAVIVAVLWDPSIDDHISALARGAAAAVPWNTDARSFPRTVRAAVNGLSLIETQVLHSIASSRLRSPSAIQLSAEEFEWLGALSAGHTVLEIAKRAGYSEREMFRRLHRIYRRIGARNRSEAIAKAGLWGIGS